MLDHTWEAWAAIVNLHHLFSTLRHNQWWWAYGTDYYVTIRNPLGNNAAKWDSLCSCSQMRNWETNLLQIAYILHTFVQIDMKERISGEDGLLKCFKGPCCWLVSCKTGFTLTLCFLGVFGYYVEQRGHYIITHKIVIFQIKYNSNIAILNHLLRMSHESIWTCESLAKGTSSCCDYLYIWQKEMSWSWITLLSVSLVRAQLSIGLLLPL